MEKTNNMEEYTLSVIITNYNNEKYINKCVESILMQTLPPNEIITVDDCSTDGSVKIIKSLMKKAVWLRGFF